MAGTDSFTQIAIGRGHEPHVRFHRGGRADRINHLLFKSAQDLCLECGRHITYLVEENGAALGRFNLPSVPRRGATEGAFLVSKQFAFEQRLGDSRTVDGHQRRRAARTAQMHGPGNELFAGSAFTAHQNRCVAVRDHSNGFEDVLNGLAFAHDSFRHGHTAGLCRQCKPGRSDDAQNVFNVERLYDEIECAGLDSPDRRFHRAERGHHDDLGRLF